VGVVGLLGSSSCGGCRVVGVVGLWGCVVEDDHFFLTSTLDGCMDG